MTADERYHELMQQVKDKMSRLQNLVEKNNKEQASAPKNWAYVTEAAYIDRSLFELLESFGA